jgi:polyisoprenoid-binding protein YceI
MKMRHLALLPLLAAATLLSPLAQAQTPIFEIEPQQSSIKFYVKASVALTGTFDKWDATLKFTSPEVTSGVLEIEIQSASVDTGSGMKNNKLKGKDFFDVEQNPTISFKSTKIAQTGPNTFSVPGTFTIRGVSNPETMTLTVLDPKTDKSDVHGKMVFDRKDYGMNKGIPFIKIADHVEVNIHLKAKRIGGPLLIEK